MAKSLFTNLVCQNCQTVFGGRFVRARMTCSKECYDIIRNARAGAPKGIKHTQEWRNKQSVANSGSGNPFFGKTHTPEVKERLSVLSREKRGELHPCWIADRSQVKLDTDRGGPLHKQWSKGVKDRDGWKCQIADENCEGDVVAHHILGWASFPELRYQINNGITLCHAHHPRKRAEEKRLASFFMELVSVSK